MMTRPTVPFSGWRDLIPGKKFLKELEYCMPKYFRLTGSGRAAIFLALKALHARTVAMPAYTCPSVADAVLAVGARPIFVDIDASNLGMSSKDLEKKVAGADAVIVDHVFGIPAKIEEIISVAGRKPVIEDCARALGTKINGKLAGSFGLCGITSFGLSKNIFAGGGGAVFSKNEKFMDKANAIRLRKADASDSLNSIKFFLSSLMANRHAYKYLPKGMHTHDSDVKKYLRDINVSELMFLSNQLRRYPEIIKQRNSAFHLLYSMLHDAKKIETIEPSYKHFYATPYFPIILKETQNRNKFLHYMEKKGHRLSPIFEAVVYKHKGYERLKKRKCLEAEGIAKQIVSIPTTLSKKDLMHIAGCVRRF